MKSYSALLVVAGLVIAIFSGCKEDDKDPTPAPIQDTVGASQFVMFKIDTISFMATIKGGSEDTVSMPMNTIDVTKFFCSHKALQNGQQLIRNMTLTLNNFQTRKVATYVGGQIFGVARTDVLQNGSEVDEQSWTIFNAATNKITVTYASDSLVRGTFNFRMQNGSVGSKFTDVTGGVFKIKLR